MDFFKQNDEITLPQKPLPLVAENYFITKEPDTTPLPTFEGSKDIAANQCWLECDIAQASELTVHFSDPTGIEEIPSTPQSGNIYNIAGERLSNPQKGINIIDSKKVLVK